jgi:hypothetical protein
VEGIGICLKTSFFSRRSHGLIKSRKKKNQENSGCRKVDITYINGEDL